MLDKFSGINDGILLFVGSKDVLKMFVRVTITFFSRAMTKVWFLVLLEPMCHKLTCGVEVSTLSWAVVLIAKYSGETIELTCITRTPAFVVQLAISCTL